MLSWLRRYRSAPTPQQAAQAKAEVLPLPVADTAAERLLRRLEWTTLKRLDGLLQGDYRTLFRGAGVDLVDLREYQLHDDVRDIDWNVTARLQVPHVRQYAEDREMSAWFLVDLSPSMNFGSQEKSKRDLTIECALLLARLISLRGNRVGAIRYGSRVEHVLPARSGRRQVLALAHRLLAPSVDATPGGMTALGPLFEQAGLILRRRSTVFILSDFIALPGWEAALGRLARRHDVLALRLTDPLESVLPQVGLMTMRDPETGEELLVDTGDPRLQARFAELAAADRQAVDAALARTGVPVLTLSTAEPVLASIVQYLHARRRERNRQPYRSSASNGVAA